MPTVLLFLACSSRVPPLGMLPCPASPNCVSSLAPDDDPQHHVAPLEVDDARWKRLDRVIRSLPRVEVQRSEPDYRHYTFTTALMRFTDDVEVRRDGDVAHIRSASRVGHSDLGVNRRRVESIRTRMTSEN